MKRKQVNLNIDTYLLADKLRGNKTFNDIISKALKNMHKANELELEIERLKAEKGKTEEPSHSQDIPLAVPQPSPQIECPALVLHDGDYYCFKNAPNAKLLPSLDFCESHLKWFKIVEKLTRDFTYTTCGAEQVQGKDGHLWLKCPIDYNRLHRWEDCKKADCKHIKSVKAEKK